MIAMKLWQPLLSGQGRPRWRVRKQSSHRPERSGLCHAAESSAELCSAEPCWARRPRQLFRWALDAAESRSSKAAPAKPRVFEPGLARPLQAAPAGGKLDGEKLHS